MRYLRTNTTIAATCAVAATLATTTAREQVEAVPATSCESLASLVLPNTTITAAVAVDAGAFAPPVPEGGRPPSAAAVPRGYAAGSTDTGHVGNTASFGLGHPEKVIDFGWRAVHEMTVASKQIIAAYYDNGPRFSY